MEKKLSYYEDLLAGFIGNNAPVEDLAALLQFIETEPETFRELMESPKIALLMEYQAQQPGVFSKEISERMQKRLMEAISSPLQEAVYGSTAKISRLWKQIAAAVIFMILSASAYLIFRPRNVADMHVAKTIKNDLAPGSNKAILTLSNGSRIILDSAGKGTISRQGNMKVIKLDSGQVAYEGAPGQSPVTETFNTISTPRGGQYQVTLSDGTRVWLNAASSLKYPVAFSGSERNVELTGEGYFEVAHNASKPFHVKVNGIDVKVLGTHFNINAYSDEPAIATTLLEGSVVVSLSLSKTDTGNSGTGITIKPGQQARVEAGRITIADKVNIAEATAWKNGVFRFESEDIGTIMRQVSRWYDVDVYYGLKTGKHFTGIISRNVPASEVFKMLEMTGEMHFEINGKKVTVEK